MLRNILQQISRSYLQDDPRLFVTRRDYSGGINTRQHPNQIGENQATVLTNIDLSIPGQRVKRKGSATIGNDVGNNACKAAYGFIVQGATDQMLMIEGTTLWKKTAEAGNWASVKADFTNTTYAKIFQIKESGISPDDIVVVQNGTDNPFRFLSDGTAQDLGSTAGTGTDSPPKSLANAWYGNRWWILKNDLLYFSDAYDSDYSSAFDTVSNVYRVPVGDERAIVSTRNLGMIVLGQDGVWALQPSATPAATDQPVPIVTDEGCVAGDTAVVVADDVYYMSQSGVRALKRTEQDKVQMHSDLPISYPNKDEYDSINWAYIEKAKAVYFDNKYIIALPTGSSTTNNKVWVYFPATNGWSVIDGWNVGAWFKYKVSGEERLYYADSTNGQAYRAFTGYTDDSVAITMTEEGREEDFQQPMLWKMGGTLEVEAMGQGGVYNIAVYASIDGGSYSQLGTLLLENLSAPTLPENVPFTLAGEEYERGSFPLDSLGRFRTIKVKLTNNNVNVGDIKVLGHNITTFDRRIPRCIRRRYGKSN